MRRPPKAHWRLNGLLASIGHAVVVRDMATSVCKVALPEAFVHKLGGDALGCHGEQLLSLLGTCRSWITESA